MKTPAAAAKPGAAFTGFSGSSNAASPRSTKARIGATVR